MVALDDLSADYLFSRAMAEHKTPPNLLVKWCKTKWKQWRSDEASFFRLFV
jgi:hypothetical protein